MDIVIVAQYLTDVTKPGAEVSRFLYLAKALKDRHSVEIVTTDFIHSLKKNVPPIPEYEGVKLTMLHESGYPRNVCLRRFRSHRELAGNIAGYLARRARPDIVYCGVPSLAVGAAAADFCRRNRIPFVADIQDLWPEAFKMVLNLPVVSDLLFYPMKKQADRIYRSADALAAVSGTYAARAGQANPKAPAAVVFLGTDRARFDAYAQRPAGQPCTLQNRKTEVVYIGSLEKSYDLETVIRAVALVPKVRLVVIGDGSKREPLQQLAEEQGIDCEFTGRLPYPQMVARMCRCHIAVNPIRKNSAGSVINKVGDYAMAGLPVVNTQECEEYRRLLEQYEAGLNCRCEDVLDVAQKIRCLAEDPEARVRMAGNSRLLGEEKFDRQKTYQILCGMIENLGGGCAR